LVFLAVFCFAAISLILNSFLRLAVKNIHMPRIKNTIPSIGSIVPVCCALEMWRVYDDVMPEAAQLYYNPTHFKAVLTAVEKQPS
jgi:hypothetical protein